MFVVRRQIDQQYVRDDYHHDDDPSHRQMQRLLLTYSTMMGGPRHWRCCWCW
jgi:hypothetical protein